MRPLHLLMLVPLLVFSVGARPGKESQAPAPERVSVTVATRDLAAGERVTEADIADVLVPREWVTTSHVMPDLRQYIIGQRLLLPVMKGDLISWNLFEPSVSSINDSCAKAAGRSGTAAEQVARSRQVLLERPRQDAIPGH